MKIKSLHTTLPIYITEFSLIDIRGFSLAATTVSLVPENIEYEYRYENGVHIWEAKNPAAPPKDSE